ncbi:MAG: CDP-alcohol phosphatidyltransferase family protein [Calditrichia bacterium]
MKSQNLPFLKRIYSEILLLFVSGFLPAIYLIVLNSNKLESLKFIAFSIFALCFYLWRIGRSWKRGNIVEQRRLAQTGLGAATRITLLRGTMLTFVSGTLGLNSLTDPIALLMPLCFLGAILLDAVDGFIARKTNSLSEFGGVVDTVTDGFAMAVGVFVAVRHQMLPPEFIAVGTAYYMFMIAARIRERNGRLLQPLVPGTFRRTMAGFLMGFVAVTLFGVYSLKAVNIPARIYMLFFLSGFIFDWLTVCGKMDSTKKQYARLRTILYRSLFYTLPLVLRFFLCFVVVVEFREHEYYLLMLILAFAVAFGIAARTIAVALMLLIGWYVMSENSGRYAQLALAYCSTIALLGAGASAIWEPEEKWLNR